MTYDPPGNHEGIGLRESPLLGSAFTANLDCAVWDVSNSSGWAGLLGKSVSRVHLWYEPWGSEGLWCPRISLHFDAEVVEIVLAQGQRKGPPMAPSADNLCVRFSPTKLSSEVGHLWNYHSPDAWTDTTE